MSVLGQVWEIIRNIFGNIVVFCVLAAAVFLLLEIIRYHTGHKQGYSGDAEEGDNKKRSRAALVIGASSGLGSEFARRISETEEDIDIVYLVARREDRLHNLAGELKKASRVIAADICVAKDLERLEEILEEDCADIRIFVNCAGFAKIGNYSKLDIRDSDAMVDTNVRAAVDVTVLTLKFMREGARLIEVCSTAAFSPLTHLNIYAAGKAFLYSYTRALRLELLPRRIRVTALCPWWIRDTEFIPVAQDSKGKDAVGHFPFAGSSKRVVRSCLRTNKMGFVVSTPGVMCTLHRFFSKLIPRKLMLYLWEVFRR